MSKKTIITFIISIILAFQCAGYIDYNEPPPVDVQNAQETPLSKMVVLSCTNNIIAVETQNNAIVVDDVIQMEIEAVEEMIEPIIELNTYNGITEGDIIVGDITYYCLCLKCCGKLDGLTASGYIIENGVQSYTASCNWLPFDTIIEIDGVEYTIRDRGGKRMNVVGNVDLFCPEGHKQALINGRVKDVEIKIISLS